MIVSQSEIADLMQCPAKWGFGYGDLAGFPIRSKQPPLRLREGRAWGQAVQAWHTRIPGTDPVVRAHEALVASLEDDHAFMESHGVGDGEELEETKLRLREVLIHYCATQPRLNLIGSEVELEMQHAEGWSYRCHLDGVHQDEDGHLRVVEFKLRSSGNFTPLSQIQLWRQVRWYALTLEAAAECGQGVFGLATEVRGVIVDERLGEAPKPVRFNKNGSVSATQSCLYVEYEKACFLQNQPMHPPTVERLKAKTWQQRHELHFRPDEMSDALLELESAARLLALYHRHHIRPIRNPSRLCESCPFLQICPDPSDVRLRDALYTERQEVAA